MRCAVAKGLSLLGSASNDKTSKLKLNTYTSKYERQIEPFRRAAYFLWHFMQPVLVGVIGADIDFKDWSLSRFGLYCACIFIGTTARYIVAFCSTITTQFSWKERTFIALAWIPKGTLQAALAPMAYERAIAEDPDHIEMALDVVRISVVAIVLLAPLGAILMTIFGPLLLNKITVEEHERDRRLSYLRLQSLQPVRIRGKERSERTLEST